MSRSKVRGIVLTLSLVSAALFMVLSLNDAQAQTKRAPATPARPEASRLARGQYLVTIGGCNDCHTPWKPGPDGVPVMDMSRMLSGHPEGMALPPPPKPVGPWIIATTGTNTAWAGPWGVTYTINLTPDVNTGIGIWTEDMFIKTMRTGKHMATSRMIQPPMPWFNYGKATDEDLKSIYAYLRSIPPIKNRVPEYQEPLAPQPAAMPAAKKR